MARPGAQQTHHMGDGKRDACQQHQRLKAQHDALVGQEGRVQLVAGLPHWHSAQRERDVSHTGAGAVARGVVANGKVSAHGADLARHGALQHGWRHEKRALRGQRSEAVKLRRGRTQKGKKKERGPAAHLDAGDASRARGAITSERGEEPVAERRFFISQLVLQAARVRGLLHGRHSACKPVRHRAARGS